MRDKERATRTAVPNWCKVAVVGLMANALFGLTAVAPAQAQTPIPIEEEFVVAQQLHTDISWDIIAALVAEQPEVLNESGNLFYSGSYDINPDGASNWMGTYSGTLSGTFLGDPWSNTYGAEMITTIADDGKKTLVFTLISTGTWGSSRRIPKEYRGKSFTDTGTITEKPDNKADAGIKIVTPGQNDLPASVTDMTKTKDTVAKKLTVTGQVDIKGNKEDITITLDQDKKTFKSKLVSSFITEFVVLDNEGTYTVGDKPNGGKTGETSYQMTVGITPVPEPSSLLALAGGLGFLGMALRRRRPSK